jgi:hypothetical protein
MDRFAILPGSERADLLREASHVKSLPSEVVEKDFWVCWTLARLFGSPSLGRKLQFKGGTSLSKVFGLIERFSEDVDLVLDWTEITDEDPVADRSRTKQAAFNKALLARAHTYLRETFLPQVQDLVAGVCEATIEDNPEVVKVKYPASFSSDYLKPEILLEVGPLASWNPHAGYEIRSYAAEALPRLFDQPSCMVQAIKAERTFWEKITILHHEAHRPEGNAQPIGYSRHYYDVHRIAQSVVKAEALADRGLLQNVVAFKDKFYPRGWARYDLAERGTIKLIPPAHVMKSVRRDYEDMRFMIFGAQPAFDDIIDSLRDLEVEINTL